MMVYGGNSRAHVFFKQHGWSGEGKADTKYTSRAAESYKQTLAREVAKSNAEELLDLPPSLDSTTTTQVPNGLSTIKTSEPPPKESSNNNTKVPVSPRVSRSVKKPLAGAKKTAKTGGLGAKKLATKVSNVLHTLQIILCFGELKT